MFSLSGLKFISPKITATLVPFIIKKAASAKTDSHIAVTLCYLILRRPILKLLLAIFLCFLSTVSKAQENNITVPFQRVGNLIVVSGQIGDQIGNFVLDTGAPYLVLNETYFEDARPSGEVAGGVNAVVEIAHLKVDTLLIPGHEWLDLEADVTNLGGIEDAKGIKILGLLGMSLFKDFELTINYFESQLYLRRVDKKGVLIDTAGVKKVSPLFIGKLKNKDNHIFTTVRIGNKKLSACVDTGAEACVLNNDLPDDVWKYLEVKGRFLLSGVGNQQTEVLSAKLTEMSFDKYKVKNIRLVITNLAGLSEAYGKEVDCVLGYTLLAGYVVTFNFVNETITFSTNN